MSGVRTTDLSSVSASLMLGNLDFLCHADILTLDIAPRMYANTARGFLGFPLVYCAIKKLHKCGDFLSLRNYYDPIAWSII